VPRLKNAWSYTSTPQYVFMAWYLVKHRENFPFLNKTRRKEKYRKRNEERNAEIGTKK
jgi:hypothetical protein